MSNPIPDIVTASYQELFDYGGVKLMEQGRPSYQRGTCLYRGPLGSKCFVGHLMPDSIYSSELETMRITTNTLRSALRLSGIEHNQRVQFLFECQQAHDNTSLNVQGPIVGIVFLVSFLKNMENVAKKYNLSMTKVNEAFQIAKAKLEAESNVQED